jgi:hypothetical protein
MDELTLGLIGAGAVVVGGVVVYNAWQGAKVRRRMPRPMPEEAADAMNRPERDEAAVHRAGAPAGAPRTGSACARGRERGVGSRTRRADVRRRGAGR